MRPEKFYNQFNMMWGDSPSLEEIETLQYKVHQRLEYDITTSPKTVLGVKIILCRKLSYHVVNIYIPTLTLTIIAGFTLFIDFIHFQALIMIALTSMLVTYTLYQSISGYLPNTSYMKMIDIWLIGGLILPFFVIVILVIMDSLIMMEKDLVMEVRNERKVTLKSKMFMRSMQAILVTVGGTLSLTYWIIGLNHYYHSCSLL